MNTGAVRSGSTSGILFTAVFAVGVAALAFGLAALVGEIGGKVGSWLAGSNGRGSPPAAGS